MLGDLVPLLTSLFFAASDSVPASRRQAALEVLLETAQVRPPSLSRPGPALPPSLARARARLRLALGCPPRPLSHAPRPRPAACAACPRSESILRSEKRSAAARSYAAPLISLIIPV